MALQGGDFSASHTMGGGGIRRYSRLVAISMAICAAMAIAAAVNLSLSGHASGAEELFGEGAEPSSYGPVNFAMDRGMKRALAEYQNHGGVMERREALSSPEALSTTRQQLGPHADRMLSSEQTSAALKAYRDAPRDATASFSTPGPEGAPAATQQLSEEQGRGRGANFFTHVGGGKEQALWASAWHPGRGQDARGSGQSLLHSRGTQEALRELESHEAHASKQQPMHLALQEPGSAKLLATKLEGDAGFTHVQNRGQALEAIKDLLTERLGHVGQMGEARTESLSMAHGLKVQRVRLESLVNSIKGTEEDMKDIQEAQRGRQEDTKTDQMLSESHRGRTIGHGYRTVESKIKALRSAMKRKEEEVKRDEVEEKRDATWARTEEKYALDADRREMARYGKADMARRSADAFAHKLLKEKARARLLAGRAAHEEARARHLEEEGKHLKSQSKREESNFESMAGPVKKAQGEVKLANNAFDAAEMRMARDEARLTAAHSPKAKQAALAQITKDRRLASRMEALVRSSTRRMAKLSDQNGPLTGLDSHFEGPKKRAVRKLEAAKRIWDEVTKTQQQEEVLKDDVRGELPQLKSNIRHAKTLHDAYEVVKRHADLEEGKARRARAAEVVQEKKLHRDMAEEKHMLQAVKLAERGVGVRLKKAYERDWKRLREMHEELITDKEDYSGARSKSCAHGGPCPKVTSSGLP